MSGQLKRTIQEDANKIIETRQPIGKFYYVDNSGKFIGIDNSSGDAWVEEFNDSESCKKWLLNNDKMSSTTDKNSDVDVSKCEMFQGDDTCETGATCSKKDCFYKDALKQLQQQTQRADEAESKYQTVKCSECGKQFIPQRDSSIIFGKDAMVYCVTCINKKHEILSEKRFKKIKAKFIPKIIDTLLPENKKFIGKTLEFQYLWVVESGPYENQWALISKDIPGWIPEEDLEIIN